LCKSRIGLALEACHMITSIPIPILIVLCLTLGLAPFFPEPHLLEKLRMLFNGTLTKPVDIFDLVMHGLPFVLLAVRLAAEVLKRSG